MDQVSLPLGFTLCRFEVLSSTMDEAWFLAQQQFPHRTLVVSQRQTNARGRRGRTWFSPAGNLSLSLLLRPRIQVQDCFAYAFIFALAMGKALNQVLPPGLAIAYKWPNDLYLDGAKLGGVLIEVQSQDNHLQGLVGGIGVNVTQTPENPPYPVICLGEAGVEVDAMAVLPPFCEAFHHLENLFQERGFAAIRERWLPHAYGLGQWVQVQQGTGAIEEGIFQDMDAQGAMVLRTVAGEQKRILTGDVNLVTPRHAPTAQS